MIGRDLLLPEEQTIFDACWNKTPPVGHVQPPSIRLLLEAICRERRKSAVAVARMQAAEAQADEWREAAAAADQRATERIAAAMIIEQSGYDCPRCQQPLHIVGARNVGADAGDGSGLRPVWSAQRRPKTWDRCPICGGDREWRAAGQEVAS